MLPESGAPAATSTRPAARPPSSPAGPTQTSSFFVEAPTASTAAPAGPAPAPAATAAGQEDYSKMAGNRLHYLHASKHDPRATTEIVRRLRARYEPAILTADGLAEIKAVLTAGGRVPPTKAQERAELFARASLQEVCNPNHPGVGDLLEGNVASFQRAVLNFAALNLIPNSYLEEGYFVVRKTRDHGNVITGQRGIKGLVRIARDALATKGDELLITSVVVRAADEFEFHPSHPDYPGREVVRHKVAHKAGVGADNAVLGAYTRVATTQHPEHELVAWLPLDHLLLRVAKRSEKRDDAAPASAGKAAPKAGNNPYYAAVPDREFTNIVLRDGLTRFIRDRLQIREIDREEVQASVNLERDPALVGESSQAPWQTGHQQPPAPLQFNEPAPEEAAETLSAGRPR